MSAIQLFAQIHDKKQYTQKRVRTANARKNKSDTGIIISTFDFNNKSIGKSS